VAIVRTAGFRVRPESCAHAAGVVAAFAAAIRDGEPGTRLLVALQDKAEPTRFTLLTVFDDEAASAFHDAAEWSRAFGAALSGDLASAFSFLEYVEVAGAELPGGAELPVVEG
jgi:quinol monooxygenase YgiN